MPGMNGFQLYKEILKRDGRTKVRFFTAFEEFREEFRKASPNLTSGGSSGSRPHWTNSPRFWSTRSRSKAEGGLPGLCQNTLNRLS
jgi:hypothetical protein